MEDHLNKLGLSLEDAAKALSVSRPTMLNIVHSEGFPAFRVGRRWVIPKRLFENWMEEQVAKQHEEYRS